MATLVCWVGQNARRFTGSHPLRSVTGQSFAEIAQQLQQHQAISNTTLFSIYARLHALDGILQAGEYEIPRHVSPQALLTLMSTGKVLLHSVKLAEGFRLQDVVAKLRTDKVLIDDLGIGLANNELQRLLARLNLDLPFAEGYFPDTYHVVKGTKVSDVLLLSQQLWQKDSYAWQQRAPSQSWPPQKSCLFSRRS